MKHAISKVKVFQTSNYNVFRRIEGNRILNKKKIERIITEIKTGNDILDEVPILVKEANKHLEVLEGQHRLEIAIKLKRPVHYIIHKKEMNLYNVAKINSNTEKWKFNDFINAYVKAGNEQYRLIEKFHNTYGIAIGIVLDLLTNGASKRDGSNMVLNRQFEEGIFQVKKYKEAVQVAEICKSFEQFAGWNSRPFIIAICKILQAEKCDLDILIKKFKEDPSRIQKHANWKNTLTNLEEIYNKGNSKRRTIF